MIPEINYPVSLDNDTNLYSVKDSVYLKLARDYMAGDQEIQVEFDQDKTNLFPPNGIITLVEQCSEPDLRALSFYYTSFVNNIFSGLTILDGFTDSDKPSIVTTVVMNVMAEHHNSIKEAVKAIQQYAGKRIDDRRAACVPTQGTIEARTNCATRLAFEPKAWFTVDKRLGLAPLTCTFTNQSIRLGDQIPKNEIKFFWDFGDATSSNIVYKEYTDEVPATDVNSIIEDTDGGTIVKTYTNPGIYSVSLRVLNDFGEDTYLITDLINARYPAPNESILSVLTTGLQQPINGIFKSPVGLQILITVENNGELKDDSGRVLDPIITYTWFLSDDLDHANSSTTSALYSVGGVYDISLRCDTENQSFRITNFDSYFNIVERTNIWLFTFFGDSTNVIQSSEMGFTTEFFKTKQNSFCSINVNPLFLEGQYLNTTQLVKEFKRNTFTKPIGNVVSGLSGSCLLYYATGRNATQPISIEEIISVEYNGYLETYNSFKTFTRPWNWVAFEFGDLSYFMLGNLTTNQSPGLSLTNWESIQIHNTITNTILFASFTSDDFLGQATELQENAAQFNSSGESEYGYFSTYRTANRDQTAYILKNDFVGENFRIVLFYESFQSEGNDIGGFKKLGDMLGSVKLEGQLVNLTSGLFFFNNSGSVSQYDTNLDVWRTGGPGINSVQFKQMQDTTVVDYDDETNTLLASTDGDRNAYLSFDYSSNAYTKFNELDLTFTKLNSRPDGNQWIMTTY